MEPQGDIALIGLAVMGQNLILNMNDHGFTVVAFNRTTSKVDDFLANEAKGTKVLGAPGALRRCLTNLLDNAVKYGRFARVEAALEGTDAVVRIRDGGPGIPEDQLAAVLDPFVRLESSRSRETGGTGLGLTIARNIAERHGGTLTLRNLAEGGLEATVAIPRSAGRPA